MPAHGRERVTSVAGFASREFPTQRCVFWPWSERFASRHIADRENLSLWISAYTINMTSHDPAKRRSNFAKHGIDLPACADAFDAPMLTREDDRGYRGEQRLISLGCAHGRVVVLVWTDRDEGPRLISCREASRHECQAYFHAYPTN